MNKYPSVEECEKDFQAARVEREKAEREYGTNESHWPAVEEARKREAQADVKLANARKRAEEAAAKAAADALKARHAELQKRRDVAAGFRGQLPIKANETAKLAFQALEGFQDLLRTAHRVLECEESANELAKELGEPAEAHGKSDVIAHSALAEAFAKRYAKAHEGGTYNMLQSVSAFARWLVGQW